MLLSETDVDNIKKDSKVIKQWHIVQDTMPSNEIRKHKEYIKIEIVPKTEYNAAKNQMITSYEEIKTAPFEKVNETAKLMKVSQMQELLKKINELEEGL